MADKNETSNVPEALATITTAYSVGSADPTAHKLSPRNLELYNHFLQARKETWENDIKEDKKMRAMFFEVGRYQAEQAIPKVEGFLYNPETEADILNAIMSNKEKEEELYTKDELRDIVREILSKKTPLTEEEVKQLQDEEDERVKKILARENGKF